MINSSLNNGVCKGQQMSDLDKRLDAIEEELRGYRKSFGSLSITTDDLTSANSHLGKADATSLSATSIKAVGINTDHIDIDNSVSVENVNIASQLNANEAILNKSNISKLNATDAVITSADIDNLRVRQITSSDNNTSLVDLTVSGTANINKLNLANPHIDAVETPTLTASVANIDRGTVVTLDGVVEEKVDNIKLNQGISRGDSVSVNMLKSLGSQAVQVGDVSNQVILSGESRPLWNDKVLAVVDDLGQKIVPAYKGRLAKEADIPTTGTLGDYYIITMLTKGDKSGIGFALYNGTKFDTDFFYELEGYRLSVDQDVIDDAQNVAIINEVARAKGKEEDIFNNGVRKVQAKTIAGNNLNIDLLFGAEHFGERYTGFGKDFIDGVLPDGEANVGCSLDILPNSHNTVQIMTTNHPTEARVFIRSYGNKTWTEWKKVAYVADKVADSERLEGRTLLELRQMLFDDAHPIKDTFVSNDGADDPNIIYNVNGITSTWEYIGQSFGIHGWRRTK